MAAKKPNSHMYRSVTISPGENVMLTEAMTKHACDRPDRRDAIRSFAQKGCLETVVRFVDHLREVEARRQQQLPLTGESDAVPKT